MGWPKAIYSISGFIGITAITITVALASEGGTATLANTVDRLEALVVRLERVLGAENHGSPTSPKPEPEPKPDAPAPTPQRPEALPPTTSPKLMGEVMKILSARCAKCHTSPADAGGGFMMFKGDVLVSGPYEMIMIDQVAYSNIRHEELDAVPNDEYAVLRVWINEYNATILDIIGKLRHQ